VSDEARVDGQRLATVRQSENPTASPDCLKVLFGISRTRGSWFLRTPTYPWDRLDGGGHPLHLCRVCTLPSCTGEERPLAERTLCRGSVSGKAAPCL